MKRKLGFVSKCSSLREETEIFVFNYIDGNQTLEWQGSC